jgi:LacI family transcriptional regulator
VTSVTNEVVAVGYPLDLRHDMRLACHIIMQAQGAIDGPIESVRSPIHIVTPYNIPTLPTT